MGAIQVGMLQALTAVILIPGQMSGAPHFHDNEPMLNLIQTAAAE